MRRLSDAICDSFEAEAVAVAMLERPDRWTLEAYFRDPPQETSFRALIALAGGGRAANDVIFDRVAANDWVAASLTGLAPVVAGRFVVHGRHDRARVPINAIGIEIEAALAFGTGHHGTTRGCLLALDAILKAIKKRRLAFPPSPLAGEGWVGGNRRPRPATRTVPPSRLTPFADLPRKGGGKINVLDIGTGTGILAIAAAKAAHARVLASDNDERAVAIARVNAAANHVATSIEFVHAAGISRRCFRARRHYDLVCANILLGPVRRLAAEAAALIEPGGRIVLSGLLQEQARAVISAYRARQLSLERRFALEGWVTLVMRRGAGARKKRRPE
ncbi:MAG: 50S ribosomal protein L11 methyltransferase [Rhizobiales bacterium]|nr:50S ribosomal protein L11 methyltransferase [Hyphomicrobiales bacterium]